MTQPGPDRYDGEVAYIYGYDIAYDTRRGELRELLGRPVEAFGMPLGKRGPRQAFFYRPQMVRLGRGELPGPRGPVPLTRTVKFFPVGALSVTFRVPFAARSLADLTELHEPRPGDRPLQGLARDLAERACAELAGHLIRPVEPLREAEAYTVFCIRTPASVAGPAFDAGAWLAANRRAVTACLSEEADPDALADRKVEEVTARSLSYYAGDLVVVDWDAALVVDAPEAVEGVVHIMELANVQLAELAAYDRMLDESLQQAYRRLAVGVFRGGRGVLRSLRELRLDLARLSDELSHITKFFGDWHLARIYQSVSARFHLDDWRRVIAEKLRTLNEMVELSRHDQANRWMVVLEIAIVALFVLDVVLLLVGLGE